MKRQSPTFFLIGAPKCGTSALHSYLAEHPKIFLPPYGQEYFSTDLNMRSWDSFEAYMKGFPGQDAEHSLAGERSVWYLYSQEAVPNILAFNPKAKFIVMLRNPVDMASSLHNELLLNGHEDIVSFEEAWNAQDGRRRSAGTCREPKMLQYGSVCKLGQQMQRLFSHVPRGQVKAVLLDDLKTDPKKVYEEVLEFLGVPSDERQEFPVVNANSQSRSLMLYATLLQLNRPLFRRLPSVFRPRKLVEFLTWTALKNRRPSPRKPLALKFQQELQEYFLEDIQLLENVIGRDLSVWQEDYIVPQRDTTKGFSRYDKAYFERLDQWSSRDKYRREVDQALQFLCLKPGDRVLDIGCCSGNAGLYIAGQTGCDVLGVDITEEFVQLCKIQAVQGDAHQLPFEDESFDAVYMLHVIGHLQNPVGALQEARRVLKPGGRMAIITPNKNFVYAMKPLNWLGIIKHKPDRTVLRYYSTASLAEDIAQSGLSLKTIYTYGTLPHLFRPLEESRCASSFRERVIALAVNV